MDFSLFKKEANKQFRKYTKGWTPFKNKSISSRSTIRDTGHGSGRKRIFSRPGEEAQGFDDIRAECVENGVLWEDPDFPAVDSSMFFKDPPSVYPNVEWLRPGEICDDPQLFVDGATRMDIVQGALGDCWLLAAVSCLATNDKLLQRVVPGDQNFTDDYAGIFKFQFWQYGRWVEVIIDDRLPCYNGKLFYMHSTERNEFWSALMEKAYAKIVGSYESLQGGLTSEALTDFTGGVCERINIRDEDPKELFKTCYHANKRGALMGCSIDASPEELEAQMDNGLIKGHAYSVTDVRMVAIETPRMRGHLPMFRVRNPWGDEHEWKGSFGDQSEEWEYIPEDQKEEMGLTFTHDGEFWMTFSDFCANYMKMEICYLGPDSMADTDEANIKWECQLLEGAWRRNVNAGGCRNFPKSFWTNPQYRVTIEEPDEEDPDGLSQVVVGLMQKDRRKARSNGEDNFAIGYMMYKLDNPDCGTLDYRYFATHSSDARSPQYINLRECCGHHNLEPGSYVILPTTFDPNQQSEFIMRVHTERPAGAAELDDETGTSEHRPSEEIEEVTDDDHAWLETVQQSLMDAAGEDREVGAYELRQVLNDGDYFTADNPEFDGFSIDICRSMVAMKDADLSGKLDLRDAKNLTSDLLLCKKIFKTMDEDSSGYFSSFEMRRVLNTLATYAPSLSGLRVSNATFNAIVMRYSDRNGFVRFDDFVACVIKLKTLFESFKEKDPDGTKEAVFNMDEYIQLTMYS